MLLSVAVGFNSWFLGVGILRSFFISCACSMQLVSLRMVYFLHV